MIIRYFLIVRTQDNMFDSITIFNPTTIIVLSLIFLVILIAVIILGLKAHKPKPSTGQEGMIGLEAEALEDFQEDHKGTRGNIFVYGEIWTGISEDDIKKGDSVTIISVNGMKLSVKKNK